MTRPKVLKSLILAVSLAGLLLSGCGQQVDAPGQSAASSKDGLRMLNGGCQTSGQPQLSTDREDYQLGLTVYIQAKGMECGAPYTIRITRPDGTGLSVAVTADYLGAAETSYVFDGQIGNYEVELLDAAGEELAHTHFHGSHFRYGHLTWKTTGPRTAEFSLVNAFRRGYPGSGPDGLVVTGDTFSETIGDTTLCFGDGACTSRLQYLVLAYDVAQNWVIGRAISSAGGQQTGPATGVTVSEVEPNDSIANANDMKIGDDYASNIGFSGDSDYVRFTLTDTTTVSIRTVLGTLRDSYLYLYASDGSVIAQDDDGGGGFSSLITRTLNAGTYFIRSTGFGTNTGSAIIQLRTLIQAPPGVITHTYGSNGPYTAQINSCCRINELQNPNTDYRVQSLVRFDLPDSSPVSSLPPIVNAPINTPNFTFTLPAVDAEGDSLSYRLANSSESAITHPIPNLSINPTTGVVTWNTVGTQVNQLWTTQLVVEERRNGAVIGRSAVDFLFRMVQTLGSAPSCVLNPSQTSYTIAPGQPLQFTVTGTDPDSGDTVTLNTGGLPPGGTMTPGLPVTGPSGTLSTFNWTPPASSANTAYAVSYTVTDSGGRAAQCAVTLNVSAIPNRPPVANAGSDQVVSEGTTVTLNGSATDPDGNPLAFSWSLLSGTGPAIQLSSTTASNPTFVATDNGQYRFLLTVTDSHGASSTDEVLVTVTNVAPGVTATGGNINEGSAFTSSGSFTDPGVDTWSATVDYGDGSGTQPLALSGKGFTLGHAYADNGVYTVTVTVTDDDGGVGTTTATVVVANVAPAVSAAGGNINEGSAFASSGSFTDPGADTWTATVDYGDGSGTQPLALGSNGFSLGHVYADNGVYAVTLTVTDDDGGVGTATVSVVVNNVAPAVSAAGSAADEGSPFSSLGFFTDPGADTWTATVDYGDGSGPQPLALNGNSFSFGHAYADNGVYIVTLTVTDDDGGTGIATVPVVVSNVAPSVSATGGVINESSAFTSSGSFSDPGADTWTATVDYGDGSGVQPLALNGNGFSLNHVYADNGVYIVTVTVTDDDGGAGIATASVVVNNVAPVVSASGGTVDEGSPFSGSGSFSDPGSDTWTATVDYGDGSGAQPLALSGNAFSLNHVYAHNGVYTVTVTVTDDDGGVGIGTATVVVNNVAPAVLANGGTVNEGSMFSSFGSFSDPGADTWTATVDYGDGSGTQPLALSVDVFSLHHVYVDNGVYTVTVTVTDDDGGVGTTTATVVVNNVAPIVTAAGGAINEGSAFISGGSFSDPGADTWTATVDYGDGSGTQPLALSGNGFLLSHVYADDGSYTVTLTVIDDDGGVGTTTATVVVNNVAPVVAANGAVILEGSLFASNGSFSDPGADTWIATVDYGDGSGTQPLALNGKAFQLGHLYDDNGLYVVTLTVTDDNGGVGTATAIVVVDNVAPTATASNDSPTYWGLGVQFTGVASDPSNADTAAGFAPAWSFGDGSTGSGFNASHAYATPGQYAAVLTVTDKDGGSGTASTAVAIQPRPTTLGCSTTAAVFGSGATLTAQLGDALPGALLGGHAISFGLNGQGLGTATTNAAGIATLVTNAQLAPGTYAVSVGFQADALYTSSQGTCSLTVGSSVGKVTAGVLHSANNGRGGFNVQSDGASVQGELQFQNDGLKFHAHTLTALGVSPDKRSAWFAGTGTDGRGFVAYVEDNGEPGTNDVFKLWVDGVAQNGDGALTGGNVQIH